MVKLDLNGNELASVRFREADYDKRLSRIIDFTQGCFYVMVDATDGRGGYTASELRTVQRRRASSHLHPASEAVACRGAVCAARTGRAGPAQSMT